MKSAAEKRLLDHFVRTLPLTQQKTLSADLNHSFLMLYSLFLNVPNDDGVFPTLGDNPILQGKNQYIYIFI